MWSLDLRVVGRFDIVLDSADPQELLELSLSHFMEDGRDCDDNLPVDPILHSDIHERRVPDSKPKSYLTMNDHVSWHLSTSWLRVPKNEGSDEPTPKFKREKDLKSKVSSETDMVQEKKGTRHPRNPCPREGIVQSVIPVVIYCGMMRTRLVQVD